MISGNLDPSESRIQPAVNRSGNSSPASGNEALQRRLKELESQMRRLEQAVEELTACFPTGDRKQRSRSLRAMELLSHLTPREREVLFAFARQPDDSTIAAQLGTRRQTIINHLVAIQRKWQADSREHMLLLAYRHIPTLAEDKPEQP
jgi:DNA-binding NarL/FixJ family response regulator